MSSRGQLCGSDCVEIRQHEEKHVFIGQLVQVGNEKERVPPSVLSMLYS